MKNDFIFRVRDFNVIQLTMSKRNKKWFQEGYGNFWTLTKKEKDNLSFNIKLLNELLNN
jgi:hypothetical protein